MDRADRPIKRDRSKREVQRGEFTAADPFTSLLAVGLGLFGERPLFLVAFQGAVLRGIKRGAGRSKLPWRCNGLPTHLRDNGGQGYAMASPPFASVLPLAPSASGDVGRTVAQFLFACQGRGFSSSLASPG